MTPRRTPQRPGATRWVPERISKARLRDGVDECRGCELYQDATPGVCGAGARTARLRGAGEQPGDVEDQEGEPFVCPAGRLLREVLEEAGIPLEAVFLTNVVKHFRFRQEGKRRLHQTPTRRHVVACLPWFRAEVDRVDPPVIVCLGATAAKALLGGDFRVTRQGGEPIPWEGRTVIATIHPSAALRARDTKDRTRLRRVLLRDLSEAWALAG